MYILDKYFIRPLFWDYLIGSILAIASIMSLCKGLIKIPSNDMVSSTVSDLLTISLTSAGFVLTLLTILITFKSSSAANKITSPATEPIFNLFFGTKYYFQTVKHLKNAVKSLLFVSISGYLIKILINTQCIEILYVFSLFGVAIIGLTLIRSLLILSRIINLQDDIKAS